MRPLLIFLCGAILALPACHRGFDSRAIIPGQIEISSQPSSGEIRTLIPEFGLRSVLNLRSEDRSRFAAEKTACEEAGAEYLAVAIPLEDWTPRPKLLRLMKVLQTAPRPMLIHCRNGVDRSGLAAAVALLLSGRSPKEAWKQMPAFSRWRASRGGRPLARVLMDYESFLTSKDLDSSGEIFQDWVEQSYCPEPYAGRLRLLEAPPDKLEADGKLSVKLRVSNLGPKDWSLERGGISLGLRLVPISSAEGIMEAAELFEAGHAGVIDCGRFYPVQKSLGAGGDAEWEAVFDLPARPGRYLARVDLLREGRHWFSDMGWSAPSWRLRTAEPRK